MEVFSTVQDLSAVMGKPMIVGAFRPPDNSKPQNPRCQKAFFAFEGCRQRSGTPSKEQSLEALLVKSQREEPLLGQGFVP